MKDMNAQMIVPANFDPSGKTKYPVLMNGTPYLTPVYGGPNSQTVSQIHSVGFPNVIASFGFVHLIVDGRGTGFKGRKYRSAVSKKLGKYEIQDQIAGAKYCLLR
jgi:dipeptidyl aminopeptidase B